MANLVTLFSFNGTDGQAVNAALLPNAAGTLFGAAQFGGSAGYGTVFDIPYTAGAYANAPIILANFTGADGADPEAGLVMDTAGDLFGTTQFGGASSDGTVFEIPLIAGSYASTPIVVVSFNGSDGARPESNLVTDAAGDLFGTTTAGGANGDGTVFELQQTAGGYASTPITLATFNGANGGAPFSGLVADAAGDVFGTTSGGGANNDGTVFKIAKTPTGYANTPTTLVSFNGANGNTPVSLILDAAGNLFGETANGVGNGDGTVFEITKVAGVYSNAPTTLVQFNKGSSPSGGIIEDAAGNLFGVTSGGGAGNGTVFEIANTASGYAATATTLASFNDSNGKEPSSLVADAAGDLLGTTTFGGSSGDGTVFEVTNAGFQVACYVRGTAITTTTGAVAIERLRVGDNVATFLGSTVTFKPIRWLGRRKINLRRAIDQENTQPVRFHAGSMGEGRPFRDLLVSPGHRMHIAGMLVTALELVNGASIVQESLREVEYWHIELDGHDLVQVEGIEAETYWDIGNRGAFENGPITPLRAPLDGDLAEPCLPYAGASTELRRCLIARAEAMGWMRRNEPSPWIEANGRRIPPTRHGEYHRFSIPEGCTTLRLRSRAGRPWDVDEHSGDRRLLAIKLNHLSLYGRDGARAVPLASSNLSQGFHQVEEDPEGRLCRWTNGDASLCLEDLAPGRVVDMVEIAYDQALPMWFKPEVKCQEPQTARLCPTTRS